ncbi:nuclear mitotic apparatus protein 1-like isoform X2 [Portunus trituberculatus]|uniref:nuclear mitotic apparatus protein 1-like isoform X2 n=1 Tax=Portunus trituberculatus TaxID=210409 RepID=UPI001E1CCF61|nr:nuclear mitotic apparatus protein 1-like isoform X2 [Portunus trituberculatus]
MSDDQPSLIESALAGDVGAVDSELQRGVEVDQMEDGRTALHFAASEGLLEVVKVLLYYKANPTKRSKMEEDNGGTALHLAAEGGHVEVVEELLQAKANVEVLDAKGRQASHRAASRGQRGALEVLYKHGADMDARDAGKATPLHFAAFYGDMGTVRWLVEEAGAVTTYKDKNGRQPKDVAKKFNNSAVQKFLKSGGGGGGKKSGGGGGMAMFGGPKARRSMREMSRDRLAQAAREASTHRRHNESPAPSSDPESLSVPHRHDMTDDAPREDKNQPVSLPAGLGHVPHDSRGSIQSLSPPDSPRHSSMDRRGRERESRRRTWSLGGSARSSSKGRGLRGQVEELMEIKTQQEEELEFKREEMAKLKTLLSQADQEKTQAEEQLTEMRYVVESQRQQLTEATEGQQRVIALHQQDQEAARNATARREEEVQELLTQARKDIDALRERDALSQQTIEALTKKVERLSMEGKIAEERLEQKEATLREALRKVEEGSSHAVTVTSLREEIDHLTCMMDDTRDNAVIIQEQLEKKIADLREQNERKSETIALLSDRLREAETSSGDSKKAEQRVQELREKETESQLTIASLNAKIQQLQQNITDHDTKTLTFHKQQQARIEELTEGNESKQVTIASLSHEAEQLTRRLKEQQDSIVFYQGQLQQKQREHEQKQEDAHRVAQELREEIERMNEKVEEAQKMSLTQYERGGTVVALQKRDTAQKQTIKALENRLQHLTQKMADAEQASLTVQRQQLERINALTEQLEEAQRKALPPPPPPPGAETTSEQQQQQQQNRGAPREGVLEPADH